VSEFTLLSLRKLFKIQDPNAMMIVASQRIDLLEKNMIMKPKHMILMNTLMSVRGAPTLIFIAS
jgi:hypothetical protein